MKKLLIVGAVAIGGVAAYMYWRSKSNKPRTPLTKPATQPADNTAGAVKEGISAFRDIFGAISNSLKQPSKQTDPAGNTTTEQADSTEVTEEQANFWASGNAGPV